MSKGITYKTGHELLIVEAGQWVHEGSLYYSVHFNTYEIFQNKKLRKNNPFRFPFKWRLKFHDKKKT